VAGNDKGLALLALLRRHRGYWLGMEALQTALALKPARIHEQIDCLRKLGHEIEAVPARGFRLHGSANRLSSELIEYGLGTRRVGRKVLVYHATDSTNDVAWQHATERGYDGLAVFAEEQRIGRGRLGRSWLATSGSSVLCSVLLQDAGRISSEALTLLAGLATAEAIEHICERPVRLKWPNDVTAGGLKVAGVIVESRHARSKCSYVLGIGINCHQRKHDFPAQLREKAASLWQIAGTDVDRIQVAQELLRQIDYWLEQAEAGHIGKLHDAWLGRCDDIGRRLTLVSNNQTFEGRVIDISCAKGLLLQLDSGPVRVFEGATTSVVR
jgi:BirA family transcriptional regulator, biotin operon repressor / biotin---[acetyl-CoA-carboxylase] ligase